MTNAGEEQPFAGGHSPAPACSTKHSYDPVKGDVPMTTYDPANPAKGAVQEAPGDAVLYEAPVEEVRHELPAWGAGSRGTR
jgi:hypothetical protein